MDTTGLILENMCMITKKEQELPAKGHSYEFLPLIFQFLIFPIIFETELRAGSARYKPPPNSFIQLINAGSWARWVRNSCEHWPCFDISLLPRNTDRDNSAHNHWFLIVQFQEIGILQAIYTNHSLHPLPCPLPITIASIIASFGMTMFPYTTDSLKWLHYNSLRTIVYYPHTLFLSKFGQSIFAFLVLGV